MYMRWYIPLLLSSFNLFSCLAPKADSLAPQLVQQLITTGSGERLLQQTSLPFTAAASPQLVRLQPDTSRRYQSVEGFGYTLTGGSAQLLWQLPPAVRSKLLWELFGQHDQAAGVSFLRISMGASDLDELVFSYNDLPSGQTDPQLQHFSLSRDTLCLIPLLREILAIRPDLGLMATPWSAPAWMKSNQHSIGGSLLPACYDVYARYFVRYLQAMAAAGIPIRAVTPQNEPRHDGNNPSMLMTVAEQTDFIKNHLGPALRAAGLPTRIIIWDHNCDQPDFPIQLLNDPLARTYVDGSAFHLYAGDISALSTVQRAHPDKHLYFTEQWTGAEGHFGGDLLWHSRHVIIGSMRHWSRIALEWNLANDPFYRPHTPGGCQQCKGALTIDGQEVVRNVSYYIIAQIARWVVPGSVRIHTDMPDQLPNVAFLRPDGRQVLVAMNDSSLPVTFTIQTAEGSIVATLPPAAVGSWLW